MADDTQDQPQDVAAPAAVILPPPVVDVAQGLDETQPGGRYSVGGQFVDAEGRPVSDNSKKKR